jgi:hypothetical protein
MAMLLIPLLSVGVNSIIVALTRVAYGKVNVCVFSAKGNIALGKCHGIYSIPRQIAML